ncbi:MAG: tripartite tricarboxylate transporter substrate-binding protein [Alphaproteobacteria bacterium]|nr:tripartite tricarboxylate transporter substrate-binding protein [Alphaproteobacteria bacterium]
MALRYDCSPPRGRKGPFLVAALLGLGVAAGHTVPAQAQAQVKGPALKGNKVEIVIGYRPGGSYGFYARLYARHLGKVLPGNPAIVPKNMPGAGSLVAANYLYTVAPRDGTVLGVIGQSVYLMQQLKRPKINFDAKKFTWVGRFADAITLVITWNTSKVKTIADAKKVSAPIAVGGTLSGSTLYISFLNELVGTKFRPVKGYSSAGGFLAMERGEMDGTSSVSITSLYARQPTWVQEGKVNLLVQVTMKPSPQFPQVPGIMTLVKSKEEKAMMEAIVAPNTVGRAIMAPPSLSIERVAQHRTAFDLVMASKAYQAEAKKLRLKVKPMSGADLQAFFLNTPDLAPNLVARMQKVVAIKYRSIKKSKKEKKN